MKKIGGLILCVLCGFIVFGGANSWSQQSTKRTTVVDSVEGIAQLQQSGETNWEAVTRGMQLNEGDTIVVQSKSRVNLKLDDNGMLKLKEGTIFTVKEYGTDTSTSGKISRFFVWVGGAISKVPAIKSTDKFEMHTPVSVCSIRGTEFSVDVTPDKETTVKVMSGTVAVKDSAGKGQEVLVKEGQQTVVKPDSVPTPPQKIPPEPKPETKKAEKPAPAAVPTVGEAAAPAQPASKPESKASSAGPGFNMNGNFGTVVLTDSQGNKKIYTQLSLKPELSFWKIGVGLDIYLYIDENNNVRMEDWNSLDAWVKKIWYIRFGQKGETVYAYVGGFPGVTLGHGLIMNRYSNMSQYPSIRKIGAELDLNFGGFGMESIFADVNRAEVFGGRVYVRPLYGTGIPIIRNLGLGVSAATDQNLDSNSITTGDQMTVYGTDLDLPIVSWPVFSALAFADVAQMKIGQTYLDAGFKDSGIGYTGGLRGTILTVVNYRAEYRKLENSFVPSYFGPFYDIERIGKPYTALIPTTAVSSFKEGPYGELSLNLLNMITALITIEDYTSDPQSIYPYLHGELRIDPALLMGKLLFSASYDKRNVNTLKDLTEVTKGDAIITTEVGYPVSNNIFLIVINRQTFDALGKPVNSTSFETRIKF